MKPTSTEKWTGIKLKAHVDKLHFRIQLWQKITKFAISVETQLSAAGACVKHTQCESVFLPTILDQLLHFHKIQRNCDEILLPTRDTFCFMSVANISFGVV